MKKTKFDIQSINSVIQNIEPYSAEEINLNIYNPPPPPIEPLVKWRSLWPFLKAALSKETESNSIDIDAAVQRISEYQVIGDLPREKTLKWSANAIVIVDFDIRLSYLYDDMNSLLNQLLLLRGGKRGGLQLFISVKSYWKAI